MRSLRFAIVCAAPRWLGL
uniref:Uncharacterized protein n=1 Tax=Arundo donax TaxID=35708 RepID=A0A0A9FHV2_ARUDO